VSRESFQHQLELMLVATSSINRDRREEVKYMESYTKPEIRDYGTLTELTAICAALGTGDSAFHITLPNGSTSLGGRLSFQGKRAEEAT